jgi:hypothetical protein
VSRLGASSVRSNTAGAADAATQIPQLSKHHASSPGGSGRVQRGHAIGGELDARYGPAIFRAMYADSRMKETITPEPS